MQATVFAPVLANGAMSQVTVISGVERRRRWSYEQKQAVLAAAARPGARVAAVARAADLLPSQIYRWRRQLAPAPVGFAPVVVSPEPTATAAMLIELGGAVVRISASAPAALVTAALQALR